jgi:hypothetical protein
VRAALAALLGETWPLRCAVLLEEDGAAREELHGHLVALAGGEAAGPASLEAGRKALVTALRSRDREALVYALDRELLGLPRRTATAAWAHAV